METIKNIILWIFILGFAAGFWVRGWITEESSNSYKEEKVIEESSDSLLERYK